MVEIAASELPLRQRLPEYLALFAIGLAACAILGLVIALTTSYTFAGATGYSLITLGTVLFFSGGVAGGGYANLGAGAFGAMFGTATPRSEKEHDGDEVELDPRERIRRGLRPEANPQAFWQVIGGFSYFLIGGVLVFRYLS